MGRNPQETAPGSEKTLRVAVLMSAYNGGRHIPETLAALEAQSFQNFDYIFCDDCSSDNSFELLQHFKVKYPERVTLLRNEKNRGIPGTKNRLLEAAADYDIVLYHDQDDLSLPYRVEEQVRYLVEHPEVVALGGWLEIFNPHDGISHVRTYAESHDELMKSVLRYCPISQPTVALRRKALEGMTLSQAHWGPCEDYDMWLRLAKRGRLANVQKVLLRYRDHHGSTTRAKLVTMEKLTLKIRWEHVRSGLYRPSIFDVIFNLAQFLTMKIFPADFRMSLFNFLRARKLV